MNNTSDAKTERSRLTTVQNTLVYLTALSLILSTGTVYTHLQGWGILDIIVTYFPIISIIFILLSKRYYAGIRFRNSLEVIILVMAYIAVFAIVSKSDLQKTVYQLVILVVFLAYKLLFENEGKPYLLIAYKNIIYGFAIISIVLWLLGPILEVIPAFAVNENWGLSGTGTYRTIRSYLGLQFAREESYIFGRLIISNRSIFVERAFAAYSFGIAWLYELFIEENKSRKRFILLTLAMFTTFSMTGYIISIIVLIMYYVIRGKNDIIVRMVKILLVPVLVVLAISAIQYLLGEKMSMGHSVVSRMSDLRNGISAWLRRPIYGYGFGNGSEIQRLFKTGYSNSISSILTQGGIMLMTLYLLCFVRGIQSGIANRKNEFVVFTISYFMFFATTAIAYRNITIYLLLFILLDLNHGAARTESSKI